jgi:anaerobic selenocysteine-containing dehydrogenase
VVAPLGESLPNQEIFRRLATAIGFDEPELHASDASLLSDLLTQIGSPISYTELARKGTIEWRSEKINPFANGDFATTSGRIEIASEQWEKAGLSRAPKPAADKQPKAGWLRVLSPADQWLLNSSYANDKHIAKKLGTQKVWLHPHEAQQRKLREGQSVTLRNPTGSLTVRLALDDTLPEGVALLPKGRWPSLDEADANVNALYDGAKTDLGESSAVHSVEAEIIAG